AVDTRGYRASPSGGSNVRPHRCSTRPKAATVSYRGISMAQPSPVAALRYSAAATAIAADMPETLSATTVATYCGWPVTHSRMHGRVGTEVVHEGVGHGGQTLQIGPPLVRTQVEHDAALVAVGIDKDGAHVWADAGTEV